MAKADASAASSSSPSLAELSAFFPKVPEAMEFESWWTEGGTRRYMLLVFRPLEELFEVLVDDSKVPLKVAVFSRRGEPLRAWDVHVGTVVDILGKPTTLHKAALGTSQWLDSTAWRLFEQRQRVEAELAKFMTPPSTTHIDGSAMAKMKPARRGSPLGGQVCAGQLARAVLFLKQRLKVFREGS
eukprot:RCo042112